jgi:hypothetical protein
MHSISGTVLIRRNRRKEGGMTIRRANIRDGKEYRREKWRR